MYLKARCFIALIPAAVLFLGLSGFATVSSFGQLQETYFHDEEPKDGGSVTKSILIGNDIVFAGATFTKTGRQTTITRIDNTGTILWVSALPDIGDTLGEVPVQQLILGVDGDLYVASGRGASHIFRINAATGAHIWRKQVAIVSHPAVILDFATDKLLLGYSTPGTGGKDLEHIDFLDKATGNLTSLIPGKMFGRTFSASVASDASGNICFTRHRFRQIPPSMYRWMREHFVMPQEINMLVFPIQAGGSIRSAQTWRGRRS